MQSRIIFAVFASLLASACAHSVEGIEQHPVVKSYSSAQAPDVVARCLQSKMPGLHLEIVDGGYSVSNKNQFGAIIMNWRIRQTSTGSTIELRKTNSIAPGVSKAEACF